MSTENITAGPLLSDEQFFSLIDLTLPGLSGINDALAAGDTVKAKHIFAEYLRNSLDRERFFKGQGIPEKPVLTESLRKAADRALRHEMESCGTPMKFEGKVDWFANPTYNKYAEWTWQLSRHEELFNFARAYRASGDEKYAEGCAELFDSWVKQAVRPDDNVGSHQTLCWRTIECGIRMGLMWPEIIHSVIVSPAFTDDILVDWCKSVYEHSDRMRKHPTVGNWLVHELDGLLHSGVLYPFFKESAVWTKDALDALARELASQVFPDGFQFELTTRYQIVVVNHYTSVINLCEAYGITVPKFFYETMEKMLEVYVELMQADGNVPDINDGSHSSAASFIANKAFRFPGNEKFRFVLSGGKEGKAPDHLSYIFPCSGLTVFRSGWSKDDVSAFFDAGLFGQAHQHEDKLNLLVYAYGRQLVCEGNTYAYDTSDMRKYCLSTRAHNTARVNGLDQNRRAEHGKDDYVSKRPENVAFYASDNIDYASGVYDEGYGPDVARLAVHSRSVIFVKKPKEGAPFFVVTDRFTSQNPCEYEIIWHMSDSAKFENATLSAPYLTAFVCGDTGNGRIVSGVTDGEVQGWVCRTSLQGDYVPVDTLLYTVKGSGDGKETRTVTVLAPHKDGETPIEKAVSDENGTVTVFYRSGQTETINEKEIAAKAGK